MPNHPPFQHLESAYQLHFYLCLKSHYLRPLFTAEEVQATIQSVVQHVCSRNGYHLLDLQVTSDHVRLLLSLKPDQTVSRAVQMVKGNLSRHINRGWARGYFARSSGKADLETVRRYVEEQPGNHGYSGDWTRALTYANPRFRSPAFQLAHCVCVLNYHLVLVTKFRAQLFDEHIAPGLIDYIVAIGDKRGFKVDRLSLAPDHIHLIIEALPDVSIDTCALSLVNNTRLWMENRYWGVLKQTGCWDVWQPSFYAGTVGEYSTAQVRRFLGQR